MKKKVARVIKSKIGCMVTVGLLVSIVLSGLPYTITHNPLFSPSHAHAATSIPFRSRIANQALRGGMIFPLTWHRTPFQGLVQRSVSILATLLIFM